MLLKGAQTPGPALQFNWIRHFNFNNLENARRSQRTLRPRTEKPTYSRYHSPRPKRRWRRLPIPPILRMAVGGHNLDIQEDIMGEAKDTLFDLHSFTPLMSPTLTSCPLPNPHISHEYREHCPKYSWDNRGLKNLHSFSTPTGGPSLTPSSSDSWVQVLKMMRDQDKLERQEAKRHHQQDRISS